MKKKIALVLVLALSLISVLALCVSADTCAHDNTIFEYVGIAQHIEKCVDCGEYVGVAEPHSLGGYYSENGYHVKRCQVCDFEASKHFIEVGEPEIIKQPTCTENGTGVYYCVVCGELADTVVIDMNKDSHENECLYLDAMNHIFACKYCDTTDHIEAHTWDTGVVIKQPTTTENGVRVFTCTLCKGTKTETIDYIDLDKLFENMTQAEATDLYKKIFDKYQTTLVKDLDVGFWYDKYFCETIAPSIMDLQEASPYYDRFSALVNTVIDYEFATEVIYMQGYNDAMKSVIDKNPVQGLFQGLWASLIAFFTIVGNGIGIGGISLFGVVTTVVTLLCVWFVLRLVFGKGGD